MTHSKFFTKRTFITSIILNIVLLLFIAFQFAISQFIDKTNIYDVALFKSARAELCEHRYQQILNDFDRQYPSEPEKAATAKKNFAIEACLRNYKTGEQLNLQPLIDQVK